MIDRLRRPVTVLVDPLAGGLVRAGLSPHLVTGVGTLGVVVSALVCLPRGWFVPGALLVGFFACFDILDGALARRGGRSSAFGAVLDASCDRIADGAVFGALVLYWAAQGELGWAAVTVWAQVVALTVPYVNARAEAGGLPTTSGWATRADRLLILGAGTLTAGLGVPGTLATACAVLAVLGTITVGQRIAATRRSHLPATDPTHTP